MYIHGPMHVHGAQPINAPHRMKPSVPPSQAGAVSGPDQLEISPQAEFLSRIREMPEVRADRVSQIRAAIASGTYETADKLDRAVDRLLDELA
ncbi:MAG: flagellar biosynthesis anti-sigma factor FlgM [Planctomycetes bacterium]|nr:flagellar biosynthesis anti-sigma factor FlgM [Planctomycetota bacterium]